MSELPDMGHEWPNASTASIVAYWVVVAVIFAALIVVAVVMETR